jgi:hypothetical protein
LSGIAFGRKSWLFGGSDRGGERAAVMLTLIRSSTPPSSTTWNSSRATLQAWLADVPARIADHKITDLGALLPWNCRRPLLLLDHAA